MSVKSISDKLITVASQMQETYDEAKNAYENGISSVPNPLEYATELYNTFNKAVFPENYEITINAPAVTTIANCFQAAKGIVKVTLKGNIEGKTMTANSGFASSTLTVIDLTDFVAKLGVAQFLFHSCTALKEVKGMLDLSEAKSITQMFYSCGALEEIRFKPETIKLSIGFSYSPKLSSETVQSIIDGLATVETQQILTLHGTTSSALTSEQILQITNKNWLVQ